MNKVIVTRSLIGLALTGGTATGIAFLSFPQSKQLTPEEQEAKRKLYIEKRRKRSIDKIYEIYGKNTTDEARKEIANTIGANERMYDTTFYFADGKFVEDDDVITAINGWCITGAQGHEKLVKYSGFDKDRLCGSEE